ncbi:hypothetical protein McanMca71_006874 [Microsporum canis]
MFRSGNANLGYTRASGASTVLSSKRIARIPSVLIHQSQHPSYPSRHYSSVRTWKSRNYTEDRESRPYATKWGAKDRHRAIGDRGRWQRKTNKEETRLTEETEIKQGEEGEGEENEEYESPGRELKKRLSQAEFEKEMQYIQRDRVALARRVKQLLTLGHEEKAILLVRASQNAKIDCIASWNALIEYKMKNGHRKEAMKLFNDMKKRGRAPNERTFTTLLSGLAAGSSKNSSETAIRLFESMKNANSESKPNIIHINAVLNVCARNGDMKNLWAFAGEIPEHGESAPNSVTYTIILNAIRTSVLEFTDTLDPGNGPRAVKEIRRRKRIAVSSGKKLWGEIISKWRKGDLVLDSKLVTSMARLLAIEESDSFDFDILLLYNQCMGLAVPTVIEPDIMQHKRAQEDAPDNGELLTREEKRQKEEERKMLLHLFDPVDIEEIRTALKGKPGAKKNPTVALPPPTNAELSFLIQTCQKMAKNGMASGRHYWTILTSAGEGGYNVKPDSSSCHEYLRLLRQHRASAESLRVVQNQMVPENLVAEKTITIALSTCSRDRNNPNVLDVASKLLDISGSTVKLDPSLILRYIELVRALVNREKLVSDSANMNKIRLKYSLDGSPTVPAELHQTRLLKALTHLRLRTRDAIELLAFGYIKQNKKPTELISEDPTQGKEKESTSIPSIAPNEAEEDAMVEKALRKLESGPSLKGPSPHSLLDILWQSLALYKRILGPQLIPAPSDSSPDTSSVSSYLSDSDRNWLAKDCERLSMFGPYFKQFGVKENADNSIGADNFTDRSQDV